MCPAGKATCLFLMSVFSTLPREAAAFDKDEHIAISNIAYGLAINYRKDQAPTLEAQCKTPSALCALWSPEVLPKTSTDTMPSYGNVVACVDYFLTPEKLLAYGWKWNLQATDSYGLPTNNGRPPIRLEVECYQNYSPTATQAAHNNLTHFQQNALISYSVYHMAAMTARRSHGNLYGALFLNAIADHYLEDFLAPGHIVTPRDNMSDVPATAMHDRANEAGIYLQPTNLQDLRGLAAHMCDLEVEADLGKTKCHLRAGLNLESLNVDSGVLAAAIDDLFKNAAPAPILMRGDQRLWDTSVEQQRQRIFMVLVVARSVLDVLDESNHFDRLTWVTGYDHPSCPDGDLPAYSKTVTPNPYQPCKAAFSYGAYKFSDRTSTSPAGTVTKPSLDVPGSAEPYRTKDTYLTAGLSLSGESISSLAAGQRLVTNLEFAWGGVLNNKYTYPDNLTTFALTPTYGYMIAHDKSGKIHGPTLRVPVHLAEMESSFGPYVRWLTYRTNTDRARRWEGGLRLDVGFSSYVMLFVAAGRGAGRDTAGGIGRGWTWTGGINVSAPVSRMFHGRPAATKMDAVPASERAN